MECMVFEDFDVERLAAYLHLFPEQVSRLADRGKLPGRKVNGQWRFPHAEVHHWLERRIGLSDEEELVEMETALQRAAPPDAASEICLAEMIPIEAIAVPLGARTRQSVIDSMVELASATGWLWDPERMADAVRSREDMHSTALENGVALLHPRRPLGMILDRAFLSLGITRSGIPFGSGVPLTDVFFLICSIDDSSHLRTLARLSRLLTSAGFLDSLRSCGDAAEAHALIAATEKNLS